MCKYCDPHSDDCCIWYEPLTKEWYEDIQTGEWDEREDEYVHQKNYIKYCPYCGRKVDREKIPSLIGGTYHMYPVLKVLDDEIEKYEKQDDEASKIVYQCLIRGRVILENLEIYGVNSIGMTYEEFAEYVNKKRHVLFMDDEDMKRMKKALDMYNAIKQIETKEA